MSAGAPIQGVFAALPTPFDEQRALDAKALDYLVDYLLARELGGLALLTEAGEDPLLLAEERRAIVKAVTGRAKGKKSVVVSISAPSSQEAAELARFAEQRGAAAILLATPRIPGVGYRELYRFVDRVVKAMGLPVLLWSRPGNALSSLLPEELTALIGHPGLKGVVAPQAITSGIEGWSKRFKGKDAAVAGGNALALSRAIKAGAHGAVCALSVVASAQAEGIWRAITAQNPKIDGLEAAMAPVVELLGPPLDTEAKDGVHKLASRIARRSVDSPALAATYPFAAVKEILRMQGHPIRADVRAPYEPMRPEAGEKLRPILQHAGILS